MINVSKLLRLWTASIGLTLLVSGPARAASIVLNGGFESGFTSWTRVDQIGSDGTFFLQSGTSSPVNGDPVPAPPGGVTAAMTDAGAPGSHVLYQDFVVPFGTTGGTLSFDWFIGNRAGAFFTPNTLDFSTPALNQQARVDLLVVGNPFSLAAGDLLLNVFRTNAGDPAVSGYNSLTVDVSAILVANVGNTIRLRFAEVDNVFIQQFGVDNVSIQTVPEPGTSLLLATGVAAAIARRRRSISRDSAISSARCR